MGRHVVVGAGTIGTALAVRLAGDGHEVVVVSRRGGSPVVAGVTGVAMDATDTSRLTPLARGAEAIYNCANPRYHRWERDWPPIASSVLDAAAMSGAVLVTLSNLYAYGPVDHAMSEDDTLSATSRKGGVRASMWLSALVAHQTAHVRATEVRASDYFGPGITSTGVLGERVVPRVLDHSTISLLGDLDAPHSWTYVDDVVTALVVAGRDPRAWGRPWHVPTSAPRSAREAVEAIANAAGLEAPRVRSLPWALVRAAGLVAPQVRELREIAYQFNAPFVVDSSAFTRAFGVTPTDFDEACTATVQWWRRRRGFPLPARSGATPVAS